MDQRLHTTAKVKSGTFDKTAHAYLLQDTPPLMSLGTRRMEAGYSVVWPSGQMPLLMNDKGLRIDLTIHDNTPYMTLDPL